MTFSGSQLRERTQGDDRLRRRRQVHLPRQRQGLQGGDVGGRNLHEGTAEDFKTRAYTSNVFHLMILQLKFI